MGEMIQKSEYDELKEKYDELNIANGRLIKELDRSINEYAKFKEDYNKLVDENKALTGLCDAYKSKSIAAAGMVEKYRSELDPVLSETPSVVINTKSINITFDNHTNNFKEDDTND